jgi:hypothetical protein
MSAAQTSKIIRLFVYAPLTFVRPSLSTYAELLSHADAAARHTGNFRKVVMFFCWSSCESCDVISTPQRHFAQMSNRLFGSSR